MSALRVLLGGILMAACAATASAQEARLFWVSDPVEPGEVAVLFGHALGPQADLQVARLNDDPPGPAFAPRRSQMPAPARPAELLQGDPECLKFLLPAALAPGVFAFAAHGPQGTVFGHLNRTAVRWLQGDQGPAAAPGGWVRAFGTRLAWPGSATRAALVPAEDREPRPGAREIPLTAEDATPWSARFALPADFPPGEYLLAVHAGQGGPLGWSEGLPLRVVAPETWPSEVFNVRDFGAQGIGSAADAAALRAALAAAEKNGGGIVYLPRGMYMAEGTLRLPPRTVLRGEQREWSALFWPERDEPLPEGQIVGSGHFAVEDLTLYCSNYGHFLVSDLGRSAPGHVRLERLRVRAVIYRGHLTQDQVAQRFARAMRLSSGGGDTVRLGGPNLLVRDSDFYGSGRSISLNQADGALITGNRFYQGRWGWYNFNGCEGVIFENNQILGADLMSTGGGLSNYGTPYSRNVYYAGNTLRLLHGWDREAMTTDAGGGAYHGGVDRVEGTRLALADDPTWGARPWQGAGVFILGGRGMGQFRRLVSYAGRLLTLDRPWDVDPDATSVLTLTALHENYFFLGNRFEDAGISLQYYGTSIGCIAAGNVSERAGGFYNSGRWYAGGYQPSWFNQFLDNEILEGNGYRFGPNNALQSGLSFIGTQGLQRDPNTAPLALCSLHRRNRLHNNARLEVLGVSRDHPGVLHVLLENNHIADSPVGLSTDHGVRGLLSRGNRFHNVTYETWDPETVARAHRERLAPYLNRPHPVAHWAFEDPTPATFANSADPQFYLMPEGSPTLVPGLRGQAVRLDGTSYLVAVGSEILNLESFTLSAWIRPEQISGRFGVIAKRTTGDLTPYVLALRNGALEFNAADTEGSWTGYNFISRPCLQEAEWQHVALVMDKDRGAVLYHNGEPVGERPPPPLPLVTNTLRITLGFEAWGGPRSLPGERGLYVGDLDEVKLWSRALSPEEIQAEHRSLTAS